MRKCTEGEHTHTYARSQTHTQGHVFLQLPSVPPPPHQLHRPLALRSLQWSQELPRFPSAAGRSPLEPAGFSEVERSSPAPTPGRFPSSPDPGTLGSASVTCVEGSCCHPAGFSLRPTACRSLSHSRLLFQVVRLPNKELTDSSCLLPNSQPEHE